MSIQLHRKTGWVGTFGRLNVLVNDKKRKKIENNDSVIIKTSEPEATIQVSTYGMKSNKIKAEEGDQLLLTSTFWGLYGFTLLLILLVINSFIQNTYFAGFMLFYAIVMGISMFFPGAHQKIEKKDPINQ